MKTIKKLSVVIIALAMCILLGVTVLAEAGKVQCSAELDKTSLCVSDKEQKVTLTLKMNQEYGIDGFQAAVVLPEDWKIESIVNDTLTFTEDDYNLSNGRIIWLSSTAENISTQLLAKITISIPANTKAGTYTISVKGIQITHDYATIIDSVSDSVSVEVEISEHSYNTNASNSLASAQTCEEPAYYYVKCDNCDAVSDTKTVAVGSSKGHAYPATPSSYTNNGDTHTAHYVCGNDATHTKSDAPVEHTYDQEGDKCVCGAEKPGLKGDVNLDGEVTLTDAVLAAQYFMDWDTNPITDAKVFYNADFNSDGTLSLTDAVEIAKYFMNN